MSPRPWRPFPEPLNSFRHSSAPGVGGPIAPRTQAPDCARPPPGRRPAPAAVPAPGPASHTSQEGSTGAARPQLSGLPAPPAPTVTLPSVPAAGCRSPRPASAGPEPPSQLPAPGPVPSTSSEVPQEGSMSGPGLAPSSAVPGVTCQSGLSLPKGPSRLVSVATAEEGGAGGHSGVSHVSGTAAPYLNPPSLRST